MQQSVEKQCSLLSLSHSLTYNIIMSMGHTTKYTLIAFQENLEDYKGDLKNSWEITWDCLKLENLPKLGMWKLGPPGNIKLLTQLLGLQWGNGLGT